MRKRKKILYIVPLLFLFASCSRDFESEGISRITNYPVFEVAGGEIISIVQGASFTDPGVKATEGGRELEVTSKIVGSGYIDPARTLPSQNQYSTPSAIDTNVPGMYIVTYSAINSDGFPGSATRLVFVLKEAPAPSVDLSGDYSSGSSPASVVTKVAPGVFYATNAWGGGSSVRIGAYLISTDGVSVNVPQQESQDRIFGFGNIKNDGTLDLKMSRPSFPESAGGPLLNISKVWVKN